ncbi:esterase/lipase family protein [Lentzea sp. HUAS TT2]|uniref:esterase/lipase family protein n=1 Tax=Lentzea sp. HUAS TT2 TaxID=3447454 RepID=UPI003F72639B
MDLVIILPGIMGSTLESSRGAVWNTSAGALARGLPNVAGTLARLALPSGLGDGGPDPNGHTPADLVRGWSIWPGFHSGPGYGAFVDDLLKRSARSGNVRLFPYDWRLSNRYSAHRLRAFVESELSEWRDVSGRRDAKVTFIAHSMGGLVARYYLEVLGGRELARHLITLGTPYSGSVKAVQLLAGSVPWPLGRWSEPLREAARSMPALWQLLPVYHCVDAVTEPRTLTEVEMPTLFGAEAQPMVEDGLRFHDEIKEAIRMNGEPPYRTHVIVGHGQPTVQSVRLEGLDVTYPRRYRSRDYLGDGTVARFAAVPAEWSDDADAIPVWQKHGSLPNHKYVRDLVWTKAHAVNVGGILSPPVKIGLDVPEVAAAGSPLPVMVTASRPNLRIMVRLKTLAGDMVRQQTATFEGAERYSALLSVPPGIWLVEAVPIGETTLSCVSEAITITDE